MSHRLLFLFLVVHVCVVVVLTAGSQNVLLAIDKMFEAHVLLSGNVTGAGNVSETLFNLTSTLALLSSRFLSGALCGEAPVAMTAGAVDLSLGRSALLWIWVRQGSLTVTAQCKRAA
jgi:hypothetical protein